MYDVERIGGIISDIERYFRDLEALAIERVEDLVFYRNLLSHEYYELTEEDVFEVFRRISAVKMFVERIKEVLKE